MSVPPDPPRRIEAEPPVVPVATGPDRIALLADDLRSLRTALILVGLLSLGALGAAVYAIVENEDDDEGRSSLRDRTGELDRRVDELEEQATRASEESDVAALRRRLTAATAAARTANRRAAAASETASGLREQVTELGETNEQLADRLQALEDAAEDDAGAADEGDAGTDAP